MSFDAYKISKCGKSFQDFFILWEYLYKLEFSYKRNFFQDIIVEDSFTHLLKYIFKSKCLNTYYEIYEKDAQNLFKEKNKEFEENYENFIKGINYIPLPDNYKGFTDCTLNDIYKFSRKIFSLYFREWKNKKIGTTFY